MKFHVAKSPIDEDVAALVATIAKRINKNLVKCNYLEEVEGEFVVQDATNLFEQDNLHLLSQAASGGYSLHANTCIKAHDRERLVKLIRYMSRPAVSDGRIEVIDDEHVRVKLKTSWKDGITHIEMSGLEFCEKSVALIPLPKWKRSGYELSPQRSCQPRRHSTLIAKSDLPCADSMENRSPVVGAHPR